MFTISRFMAAVAVLSTLIGSPSLATAQAIPAAYQDVLNTVGKTGDFKDGVLKVNVPPERPSGHDQAAVCADTIRFRRVDRADGGWA